MRESQVFQVFQITLVIHTIGPSSFLRKLSSMTRYVGDLQEIEQPVINRRALYPLLMKY
jgi:hypothetical protein